MPTAVTITPGLYQDGYEPNTFLYFSGDYGMGPNGTYYLYSCVNTTINGSTTGSCSNSSVRVEALQFIAPCSSLDEAKDLLFNHYQELLI